VNRVEIAKWLVDETIKEVIFDTDDFTERLILITGTGMKWVIEPCGGGGANDDKNWFEISGKVTQ
jgi:hypothetical protein